MDRKVELRTKTKFEPTHDEFKYFYSLMSLVQFPFDCHPEYQDMKLLKRLRNDLCRFNKEMIKACESDSNNLVLSQIRNFIQRHYTYVNRMELESLSEED